MPLKGINPVISPDLLRALAMAGHGDEVLLADTFFPSTSIATAGRAILIRCDGVDIPILLEAILQLIELDAYVYAPVTLMELAEQHRRSQLSVEIWEDYAKILTASCKRKVPMAYLERFDFYERAKKAFIIVHTGYSKYSETTMYGNMILRLGIVDPRASSNAVMGAEGIQDGNEHEPKFPKFVPRVRGTSSTIN